MGRGNGIFWFCASQENGRAGKREQGKIYTANSAEALLLIFFPYFAGFIGFIAKERYLVRKWENSKSFCFLTFIPLMAHILALRKVRL